MPEYHESTPYDCNIPQYSETGIPNASLGADNDFTNFNSAAHDDDPYSFSMQDNLFASFQADTAYSSNNSKKRKAEVFQTEQNMKRPSPEPRSLSSQETKSFSRCKREII